jgi:alpha-galactosidase
VINFQKRCVDLEATVCLDRGFLELIACTQRTKEHESIVVIDARPMHIHTALLLLGAIPGNPATREPSDEHGTRWIDIPPQGDPVNVYLVFENNHGEMVEHPISKFVAPADEQPEKPRGDGDRVEFPHTFLFAGSLLRRNGEGQRTYSSDVSGNVISTASFGDELLCLPGVHDQHAGSLLWQVDPTELPEVGSSVTLRLRPKKINTDPKQQLPDPDTKPAAIGKPVKVFILLGQSNMLGFGKVGPEDKSGTLTYLTKKSGKYAHLVDDEGAWTQRKDVRYVQVMHRRGKMSTLRNEWLTVKGNVGPELQFGHIMGHVLDEPVLVLKSCIGNRSLGWDLLPPGSEQFEFEGKIYAGYKESPLSWEKGTKPVPIKWYAGKQYDDDIADAKKILAKIGEYYPGAKSYEVAGFVWWQGHKDQNAAHSSRYEQNLVHLIKTLRKDFDAPEAKFVLATIAFGGNELKGHGLAVANAQLAVSGEKGKYPEFRGNVTTVEARPFWRDKAVSPSGAGYHYNHNAETYMEVSNLLGWAMADLLINKRKH